MLYVYVYLYIYIYTYICIYIYIYNSLPPRNVYLGGGDPPCLYIPQTHQVKKTRGGFKYWALFLFRVSFRNCCLPPISHYQPGKYFDSILTQPIWQVSKIQTTRFCTNRDQFDTIICWVCRMKGPKAEKCFNREAKDVGLRYLFKVLGKVLGE